MTLPASPRAGAKIRLPNGYEHLHTGVLHDVVIKSAVKKQIQRRASEDQRTGLEGLVKRYADHGSACIPTGKYNGNEGSYPTATGKRVRLEAFKVGQLRVYGFCEEFNSRRTFFITGFDASKKQDRANQTILKTSGTEAVSVIEYIEGAVKVGDENVQNRH